MTIPDGKIGAAGSPNIDESTILRGIENIGDSLYFDPMAASGNLDNFDGDSGTIITYPPTMHNDPQFGHTMLFEIYTKKSMRMRDITSKITTLVSDTKTEIEKLSNGNACEACHQLPPLGTGEFAHNFDSTCSAIRESDVVNNDTTDSVVEDTRLGKATEKSLDKIHLYMPKGLRNTDSIEYSDVDFGLIKGIMEGNLASLIPGIAQKAAGFVDGLAQITGTEFNAAGAISSLTGAVRNPRKEQLFNNVGFRSFEFTFNFFPKTQSESHDVMRLIKLFRFHAYPEIVPNKAFYRFPSEFQITFQDLTHPTQNPWQGVPFLNQEVAYENKWINKIARCVLTNVATEYFPLDSISTFRDGAPVAVNLTLSFTEMEAMSRNHIKAGY